MSRVIRVDAEVKRATEPACCPRCGDQTLWSHARGTAWCRLCGHTWPYTPPEKSA